jgi:hypothetical protein
MPDSTRSLGSGNETSCSYSRVRCNIPHLSSEMVKSLLLQGNLTTTRLVVSTYGGLQEQKTAVWHGRELLMSRDCSFGAPEFRTHLGGWIAPRRMGV